MDNLLDIGQWQGFFKYGPAYGDIINGQEAEFRLFIEYYSEGVFEGSIIDWEGFGVDGEIALVKGFLDGNTISFLKQYDQDYVFDEFGNPYVVEDAKGRTVTYEGCYDEKHNHFFGTWEISTDISHTPDLTFQEVASGTWRLHRHDAGTNYS